MFLERDILFQLYRELSNNICLIDRRKRIYYNYDYTTGFSVFFFYSKPFGLFNDDSEDLRLYQIRKEIDDYTSKHQIFNRIYLTTVKQDNNFYKITIGLKNREEKEQKITYGLGLVEGIIKPKAITK